MPVWLILGATALYAAGLFAIAWVRDRAAARPSFAQSPTIYALALGVYCTSWTYFGAVGTATTGGWDFLPIFLGPILVFLAVPGLLRRIGDVADRESITSLSDFLSARYGKSRTVAVTATLVATAGTLPYVALQLQAVSTSFHALAGTAGTDGGGESMLLTAMALTVFAILFGARHSDTTGHNPGLMRLLAFESLLKLLILAAVAAMSLSILPDVPGSDLSRAVAPFTGPALSTRFVTITILAMAAIICLPRQFHVAITERRSARDLVRARWAFPLYLALTALMVIPIAVVGTATLPAGTVPDLFVLALPLERGNDALALLVFLGGLSAASGMIIVSAIALSTMLTNDVIVPGLMKAGRLSSVTGDAGARLVTLRRGVIGGIVFLGYGYTRLAGTSEALAQIGLLSFAAAAQFAPALIGAITWRGGKSAGVIAGLCVGTAIWMYTLFLPAVLGPKMMAGAVPLWLDPHGLFGSRIADPLTHGVLWSLSANLIVFVGVSLRTPERLRDRIQAAVFANDQPERLPEAPPPPLVEADSITPDGLKALAARFLSLPAVEHAYADIHAQTGVAVTGDGPAAWQLVQRTERLLASAVGASSARVVMSSALGGKDVSLGDVLAILDHQTQAERFDRNMLQSMLEHVSQGISVVDGEQRLVAWNSAYVDLFDYPPALIRIGQPIEALIEYNISRGWLEDADPAEEAQRRVRHMKEGKPHLFERAIAGGRHLRIIGSPMPGGGYVTTFTDITDDKKREAALLEANETLEARVHERTSELEAMARDLDDAREEAEGANASKTRFLAAASHDLLQPLNAARLFLGAIPKAPDNDALVNKADRAIQSADGLLKGLLDISRLDHGNITAKPEILPVAPLLEDLVEEAAPMAAAAGLSIRLVPTRLSVFADPHFLESILRNFISNARRYTEEGGVLVGARRDGDNVRVEVWDTGPGIPKEKQDALFEEFRRLSDADNRGIRGAGLGLSVVRRLASLMEARIDVRSRPGRGSVFCLTVPRARRKAAPIRKVAPDSDRHSLSPLSTLRILCVDDEPAVREGMAALLESWGCSVLLAETGDEALSLAATTSPDVVIADYQLGSGMDGLVLIDALRARVGNTLPAALLTANTGAGVTEAARRRGVPIIHKPVASSAIQRCLMHLVKKGPQAAE